MTPEEKAAMEAAAEAEQGPKTRRRPLRKSLGSAIHDTAAHAADEVPAAAPVWWCYHSANHRRAGTAAAADAATTEPVTSLAHHSSFSSSSSSPVASSSKKDAAQPAPAKVRPSSALSKRLNWTHWRRSATRRRPSG